MKQILAGLAGVPLLAAAWLAVAGEQAPKMDVPERVNDAVTSVMPGIEPTWMKPAPMPGLWEVAFGPHIFYISGDGRHLLRGDILDVSTRSNLTKPARNKARRDAVESLGEENMIVFKPQEQAYSVTVFTDVDCGYCAKLHREMQTYLDVGIEVRYLAFPRAGVGSESYNKIVSVWCADDSFRK